MKEITKILNNSIENKENSADIAFVKDEEIFVPLESIAEFSGNDIRSIRQVINKQKDYFKLLGVDTDSVSFKDLKTLMFTETQTNFLLMLMRNNKNIVKFKLALSIQIERLKKNLSDTNKITLDFKQKQLEQSQKETEEAHRKSYAFDREGAFQCVSNIIRDLEADTTPDKLNVILLNENIINEESYIAKHYVSTGIYSKDDNGVVLVHKPTVEKIIKKYNLEYKPDPQQTFDL